MTFHQKYFSLIAMIALLLSTTLMAAETAEIDVVRRKQVLEQQDFDIIDSFIEEAVDDIVKARDLTSMSKLRNEITSRKSDQGQYAQQFSQSLHKYIQQGFEDVQIVRPLTQRDTIIMNLLILIDTLQDPQLIDLAVSQLNNETAMIKYWAVRCLTNPATIGKLNSQQQRITDFITQMQDLIDDGSPEVIAHIARFAADAGSEQGNNLLLQIADARIEQYADWSVQYEFLEDSILKILYGKITSTISGSDENAEFARKFAQLYSYVIQRYINGRDLDEIQKQYLMTVMIEIEAGPVSELLGQQQYIIQSIESVSMQNLADQHDKLLGKETEQGQLAAKLNFQYSTGDGNSPEALPAKPQD